MSNKTPDTAQETQEAPKKPKTKKKLLPAILFALVLLIVLLVGLVAIHASKNNRVMRETIGMGLGELGRYYTITPVDAGEYADITLHGVMKFHTDQYDVDGLGNLSVMTTDMGFMQMVSFMITPYEKAMPLCTLDFMYIMGNRKSYIEFYDLVPDTQTADYQQVLESLGELRVRYSQLTELETSESWYDSYLTVVLHKQVSSDDDAINQEMFCDALRTYLSAAAELAPLSPAQAQLQWENTKQYSSDLVTKGGVSTNVFKNALGEDTTRDFFDKVFFGTTLHAANAE